MFKNVRKGGIQMKNLIERGIQAILPIYVKNKGNCTLIYLQDEEIILDKVIKTVIKNLCEFYHLDLKSSNKSFGQLLSIKKHHPVPFNEDNVFIQAKTRVPIGRHDGAYGYINIDAIERVKTLKKDEDRTLIYLKGKRSIEVLCKEITIYRSINNGEIVKRLITGRNHYLLKEKESFYAEEDSPATKKDIAMVYMKLMEIKRGLE